jgi:hypothetical protein
MKSPSYVTLHSVVTSRRPFDEEMFLHLIENDILDDYVGRYPLVKDDVYSSLDNYKSLLRVVQQTVQKYPKNTFLTLYLKKFPAPKNKNDFFNVVIGSYRDEPSVALLNFCKKAERIPEAQNFLTFALD